MYVPYLSNVCCVSVSSTTLLGSSVSASRLLVHRSSICIADAYPEESMAIHLLLFVHAVHCVFRSVRIACVQAKVSLHVDLLWAATSLSHLVVFSTQIVGYRNMEQCSLCGVPCYRPFLTRLLPAMYSMMLSLLGEIDFYELYRVAPIVGVAGVVCISEVVHVFDYLSRSARSCSFSLYSWQ